jgi:hypothetical protein
VKESRRLSGGGKQKDQGRNQRGGVITVAKILLGGVILTSLSLGGGVIIVKEDERADRVPQTPEKLQETMVPELLQGHAEPGLTPERQVQSALTDRPPLTDPVGLLSLQALLRQLSLTSTQAMKQDIDEDGLGAALAVLLILFQY